MPKSVDFSGRPFHFIGIGGIGMSAIAHVLAESKLPVYGSDLKQSHITERLQALGAHIYWQQSAENMQRWRSQPHDNETPETASASTSQAPTTQAPSAVTASATCKLPQVVCSTAINDSNPEYRAAQELGCAIFHRSDVLAALIEQRHGIAVAGTHGKTTTSSALGYTLWQAGLDPTIIVGGEVNAWGGNARVGQGPHLVAEADESDGSLVKFRAKLGIVTNIELDHPDRYTHVDEVVEVFQTFAEHTDQVIGCIDCPIVRERLKPAISYSLDRSTAADYSADQIEYHSYGTTAQIWERGNLLGTLHLKLLGSHNLSNALAVIAAARTVGVEFTAIATALSEFGGARRRFELRGIVNEIEFIDDYAHHPSELQVTLAAARLQANATTPPRRVVAVFQPHRYSRTQAFLDEFAAAFTQADWVVLSEIYSAGEAPIPGISGQDLAIAVSQHQANVFYHATLEEITQFLGQALQPQDLVLFLGAGNLNQIVPTVMDLCKSST